MRLTDADALKQTFCAECDHSIKCEDCDIDYHFEHLAPTVDAIEVVRCKDCVYWGTRWKMKKPSSEYGDCLNLKDTSVRSDFFCEWGERREDETD